MIRFFAFLAAFGVLVSTPAMSQTGPALTTFPQTIERGCRGGRAKIYDECRDQVAIYRAAQAQALAEDKVLLVSYGAEWCIWCHVFEAYVTGESGAFTHTYSDQSDAERWTATLHERAKSDPQAEAARLAAFVAERFVLVHIENRYSQGGDIVLTMSGADQNYGNWLPHIYTVSSDGQVAMVFDHDRVEKRRDTDDWFRGYDRNQLTVLLDEMFRAAR